MRRISVRRAMSIMGTRVVRIEDPVFLSRGATYTDDLTDERLDRCPAPDARAVPAGARADHRRRRGGCARRAGGRRRGHRRGRRPRAGEAVPGRRRRHGPAVAGHRQGPVRRRAGRGRAHRAALPGPGRRRPGGDRLRPAARRRRPAGRRLGRGAAVPRRRHQHRPTGSALDQDVRRAPVRRLRRRRHPRDRQPAAGRGPAGDPGRGRGLGGRRAAHALVLHAERPELPRRGGRLARDRPRAGAPDHPRRRRRFRGEDRRRPGVRARGLARAAHRSPGALDRDPLGEHDRDGAGSGPAPDGHDRRQPGRRRARLPPRRARRRRGVPAARRGPADASPG